MDTTPHRADLPTIAVLPPESLSRLAARLSRLPVAIVPLAEGAGLALVDGRAPEAFDALRSLAGAREQGLIALLAVVEDPAQARRALRAGADEFIFESASDDEFSLRIGELRERRRARAEGQRREEELSALLDLTARYAAALDVAPLFGEVTRRLAAHMSIARCALVLFDDVHGRGHVVASSDNPAIVDLRIELRRYPEIQEAARTCQPLVIDDVGSHPLLGAIRDSVSDAGISAIAAIPLALQGKAFGVFLLRARQGPFKGADINFAWTLAHATAIAVRNARAIEHLRGAAELAMDRLNHLARYEEFFHYSSDGIAIIDRRGAIISLNPAGGEILGRAPEEAQGRDLADMVTPACREKIRDMLLAARAGRALRDVDVEVSLPLGVLTLWACCAAIPDSEFAIVSFRDITAARADERSLRKSSEFMEKLIDTSVDAVIAVNAEGDVILFNKSAARVLDHPSGLGERALGELFSDEVVTRVRALFALNPSPDSSEGVLKLARAEAISRTGECVPVLLTSVLVHEGDQPLAAVIIFSDLREKTRLEAELSRAEEQLAEAERRAVIAELAGTAAHQLNQPLTCIIGYTDLLQRKLASDDGNRIFIDRIRQEGERMAELVRKIGKITLYETKHYVGNSRIFDLERASGEAGDPEKAKG